LSKDEIDEHSDRVPHEAQNAWILKPSGKSRGRGIKLFNNLEEILKYTDVERHKEAQWVAQKYIENPLCIARRKFDIRQWVLVTSWNPLTVWFYTDCYVRFAVEEYTLESATMKRNFGHLTNNSISKNSKEYKEIYHADTKEGPMEVHGQMWHSEDLDEYMRRITPGEPNIWKETMQKSMMQVVKYSLQCVQDQIEQRPESCELLGYDFMFDEQLKPWLIEVNSSPACDYSTPIAERIVKGGLSDAVKVVVDYRNWEDKMIKYNRKMTDPKYPPPDTGKFDCIFKGPPLPAPITSLGADFEVRGKKLKSGKNGMLYGPGTKCYGAAAAQARRITELNEQRKIREAERKVVREKQQEEQAEARRQEQMKRQEQAAAMYGFDDSNGAPRVAAGNVPRCFQVAQEQQRSRMEQQRMERETRQVELQQWHEQQEEERVKRMEMQQDGFGLVPRVASMSRHTGFNAYGGETPQEREMRLQQRRADRAAAAIRKQEILGGQLADQGTGRAVGAAVKMNVTTIGFDF